MCFNIIKHQRNADQRYIESPSPISQYGFRWKSKIYQIWSRVWENNLNSLLVQCTLTQILWKLLLNFLKKKPKTTMRFSYSTTQHTLKERTLYTTSLRHAHQSYHFFYFFFGNRKKIELIYIFYKNINNGKYTQWHFIWP